MKKLLGVLLIATGATTGFSWLFLFEQYSATSPSVAVISQGKVIEKNNHGHVFFISKGQRDVLSLLELATFIILPVGGLLFKEK